MTAKNDVTGDLIQTKHSSDAYRANWDKIFKKKKPKKKNNDTRPNST